MPLIAKPLRVLIVDDNRDGADMLGLLVEEFGHRAHVTYGGAQALAVAAVFRPDLVLADLLMPGMDGCDLVTRLRQQPEFAEKKIVAITGLKADEHRALALKVGCDAVLVKPVVLTELKEVLSGVAPADERTGQPAGRAQARESSGAEERLPIREARRIRNGRASKILTRVESTAAVCDGIIRFQEEFLGTRSEKVQIHFLKDLLVVRMAGVLTPAERQLGRTIRPENGRDLIKKTRKQLVELARPMLESLVQEITDVKVSSMHHDISTSTGEEVVIFSLARVPQFEPITQ